MNPLSHQVYSIGLTKYLEKIAAARGWQAAAELGGLAALAAPSISSLSGHDWKEKNKQLAEVGGLATLAAPTAYGLLSKKPAAMVNSLSPILKNLK